jgi:hypothetical protein
MPAHTDDEGPIFGHAAHLAAFSPDDRPYTLTEAGRQALREAD